MTDQSSTIDLPEVPTVNIRSALLSDLLMLASECAEDLAVEIEDRYPQHMRKETPTYQRRYNRDIEVVERLEDVIRQVKTAADFDL